MKKTKLLAVFSSLSLIISIFTSFNFKSNNEAVNAATTPDVTMKQFASYLKTKDKHYPHSDEFIERYQQKSGGYIDLAKSLGLLVDKTQHEPNQKWHFFESWLLPSIEDESNSLSWESSAKDRVYNKLLCPELLLWIYEACEISPLKIKQAKTIAEDARVKGGSLMSMAASIRGVIPWEEVVAPVLKYVEENPDGDVGGDEDLTYVVNYETSSSYEITGLKENYKANEEVSFTVNVLDETKTIGLVKYNGNILTPIEGNTYSFTMPKGNVTLTITLKNIAGDDLEVGSIAKYNINYDLGTSTRAITLDTDTEIKDTFDLESGSEIITSIGDFEYVYGGGNGGRNDTLWYSDDLLKLGTTSVNGYVTLNLDKPVNKVKITGYLHANNAYVRVGDATSTDWEGVTLDNKTKEEKLTGLSIANKENIAINNTSSFEISFASATSIRIATSKTTNTKVPLYISVIEFIYE